jgi:hypothetical protein
MRFFALETNVENACNAYRVTVLHIVQCVWHHKISKNMIMRAGTGDVLLHHQQR